MEPSVVESRTESRTRRPKASFSELEERAEKADQLGLYQHAVRRLQAITEHMTRTRNNVGFRVKRPEGKRTIVSLYPGRTSKGTGLYADVRVSGLAELLGTSEEEIRERLPEKADVTDTDRVYGEAFLFNSEEEIDRLLAARVE